MNKRKNIILVVFLIVFSCVFLSSCVRFSMKINGVDIFDRFVAIVSDVINKKVKETVTEATSSVVVEEEDIWDEIPDLYGDVKTLSRYPLPKYGDVIGGFKVSKVFDYNERNAKVVVMEHLDTGATCFLISNDDMDKSVSLGFNTLAYDDKGIPHVFEHSTLAGSKNYNNGNLFFEMISKTYSTYLNAFTAQQSTVYPMGSLSDEQLFLNYKFYIDGIFYPNVLNDQMILDREAYRYTLSDDNSDIDMSGVVYSEMAAVESDIYETSHNNTVKTLFPDSFVSFNVGGDTRYIPEITLTDINEFHDMYYHPSNMIMTLYGDIDYEKYLVYADENYLSDFDKKTIDKEDKLYKEIDGFVEKTFDFPVSSASEIDGKSVITYAVSFEGMTPYEAGIFSLILDDLSSDAGYIRSLMNEKLPETEFAISNFLPQSKPYIEIVFTNVDESDKDTVKEIVEEAFEKEVNEGFGELTLMSFVDATTMDTEFERDSHGFTDNLPYFYDMAFADNGKDLMGYFKYLKGVADVEKRYYDGTVFDLAEKYLGGSADRVLVVTKPKKGLLEDKNKQKLEALKKMKEEMSDRELKLLVNETKEYDKWVEENNKVSLIDKVRIATLSTASEYNQNFYAYEENIEGIKFVRSDIEDIKYNYVNILLDTSKVPYEDILKLKLLSELLLYLPTTNYEDFTLSNEFSLYAYNYDVSLYNNVYRSGGYNPYLSFSMMSLDKNLDNVFDLVKELFYETKFDDVKKLRDCVSKSYNNMISGINSNPSSYANLLIRAFINHDYEYDVHVDGIDYIKFLRDVMKYSDEELFELLKDCETLYKDIKNKDGMVCMIVSDFDAVRSIKKKVVDLTSGFDYSKRDKAEYNTLERMDKNIAVACDTNVQYNYIALPLKNNNIVFNGKYYVFNNILDSDILYQEFRVKRSSYGASASAGIDGLYIQTYRDPYLKETYEVYDKLIDIIADMKVDEESLIDYKISAYSYFSYPLTKFDSATIAISEMLSKWDEKRPERYSRYMREILSTTSSDIESLKSIYIKALEEGKKISIGNISKIEEGLELFDEIKRGLISD